MILFLDDWKRFPTAKPHLETKNESFLILAKKYQLMGIKNHAFILALVNPELKYVNPHAKDLTLGQMKDVAIECSINPWYFFREVARAPARSGTESNPVEANRGNIALWWSFFNHIFIILIQIRQTGKSFSTDCLMVYLMCIVCVKTAINLLTKDDILRRKNVERIKDIMEDLPPYLQLRTRADANNGEEVTINELGNTYTTHVPQASPKRALNMGRGLTTAIFHIDEPPFQPNISVALPAALSAMGAAVDLAKKNRAPFGTILTTTAGKRDDKDGKYVYNILSDAAHWTEKFFDCKDHAELERVVRAASRKGVFRVNATFNHRQLGYSDAWLREKIEAALAEGDDAERDFLNAWTSGSQTNPLPPHILERIVASYRGEEHVEIDPKYGYTTRWFIPEEEIEERMQAGRFILAMDPSEAGGGDDISLYLIDIETLETVAAGTYNETNLITFSEWLCGWFERWENFTGIIERRSAGSSILDYLLLFLPAKGIDPFERLFNTVVHEYDSNEERYRECKLPMGRRPRDIYVRYKKCFGYTTSGSGEYSRSALYSTTLKNAAKRAADLIYDRTTIDQITGLVTRNGRIDHEIGEHDDMVIAFLLAHWLLMSGKNLAHYGIDTSRIMRRMDRGQGQMDPMQLLLQEEQNQIRQRIEEIYDMLSNETDEYVCQRLEHELRRLDKRIILESNEIYSVDDLIKQAGEMRKHRRMFATKRDRHDAPRPVEQSYISDRPLTERDLRPRRYYGS